MALGPEMLESEVVPAFLGLRQTSSTRTIWDGEAFSNVYLRLGEVQAIIYPTDPRNHSNKFIEYSVLCEHRANGTKVTKLYDGCLLMNMFGGLSDFLMWTLRPQDNAGINSAAPNLAPIASGLSTGSKVLILCVNGESHAPIIIGGVRQFLDSDTLLATPNTHFLQGAFNGFKFQINNAGELILTYGGANDAQGAPRPPNPGPTITGTMLKFAVDGSWSVASGVGDQSVILDNAAKKIDINALTQFNLTLGSAGQVNITTATGPFTLSCDTCTIGAVSGIALSGGTGGVRIGSGTNALMLGSTYRSAEGILHNAILATLQVLSNAATTIASGPPPAAGTALASAVAAAATAIASALQSFEGGAQSYLSPLNKTD